jgi:hypothetical protein
MPDLLVVEPGPLVDTAQMLLHDRSVHASLDQADDLLEPYVVLDDLALAAQERLVLRRTGAALGVLQQGFRRRGRAVGEAGRVLHLPYVADLVLEVDEAHALGEMHLLLDPQQHVSVGVEDVAIDDVWGFVARQVVERHAEVEHLLLDAGEVRVLVVSDGPLLDRPR